jgi:predicted nucleic acid-binding protein
VAVTRRFADAPPQRLYLDTDFVIACLVASEQHHLACRTFVEHLFDAGLTMLYTSSYSWLEYIHVVSTAKFRRKLDPHLSAQLNVSLWDDNPVVRTAYIEHFRELLLEMLRPFKRAQIGMNATVVGRAMWYMAAYNLKGNDALHLASMNSANVADIASLDSVFRRVDDIFLWNDAIHPDLPAVGSEGTNTCK